MPFLPRFSYQNSTVVNLGAIESARAVIDVLPLPPDTALRLRHDAFERSTKSSTAIEGNTLNTEGIRRAIADGNRGGSVAAEEEVRNYWRALDRLEDFADGKAGITEAFIQELHKIVMTHGPGRPGGRSPYRVLECPVVDQATRRVDYAPPEPKDVPALMTDLVAWLSSSPARGLPAPLRAGILSHRFISIHPFNDGNGLTGRLLATAELWRSGYKMRGFFSFEEYFNSNRAQYYDSLQMGLPVNFYDGRHDSDLTPWLNYFVEVLAKAAESLHSRALHLQVKRGMPSVPWDELSRRQQQILTRLLARTLSDAQALMTIRASDVESWFAVSDKTAREWLSDWAEHGFVVPASAGTGARTHRYQLADTWLAILEQAKLIQPNNGS
ncbi:MAG: Fic family protein [Candidatus Obscuribacterales bacterium]|nr:Fic family protein [Candidatus Obscuribacterales bacterium]